MKIAGIIAEYDPFHNGHAWQLAAARAAGAQKIIVCLSTAATQRGALPLVCEEARVKAALHAGADIVLSMPAVYAASGAEQFARAGVAILAAAGCDTLVFGAETPETARLMGCAQALCSREYADALRAELDAGARNFASARQSAMQQLYPTAGYGEMLANPNDNLAVEYCKAMVQQGVAMVPYALPRVGANHGEALASVVPMAQENAAQIVCDDAAQAQENAAQIACDDAVQAQENAAQVVCDDIAQAQENAAQIACDDAVQAQENAAQVVCDDIAQAQDTTAPQYASGSALRALWQTGGAAAVRPYVPAAAYELYQQAEAAGEYTDWNKVDIALLSRLRADAPQGFAAVRGVREGLEYRLADALKTATTAAGLYDALTTVRYPRARMRRLCLDAAMRVGAGAPEDTAHTRATTGRPYEECATTEPAQYNAYYAHIPPLPPYLHILGGRKEALGLLKSATLPASASLAQLRAQNHACAVVADAQTAFGDFSALCKATTGEMSASYTKKIVIF